MAYIKMYRITKECGKKIEAITNEKKTGDSELIYKFTKGKCPCQLESAYHIVQRFPVDEYLTPEIAHEIGRQFAMSILKDFHDYVVATHTHSKVLHNHLIFSSTSMKEEENYCKNYEKALYKLAVIASNECCRMHGLSTIPSQE